MINYTDEKPTNFELTQYYNSNLYKHYNHDVSDHKYLSQDPEFDLNDYFYLNKQEPTNVTDVYKPKPTCSRRLKPVVKCLRKEESNYLEQAHLIDNYSHKIETCKQEPIVQTHEYLHNNYLNTVGQTSSPNSMKFRQALCENNNYEDNWEALQQQQQQQQQILQLQQTLELQNFSQYLYLYLLSQFNNKQPESSTNDLLEKYREFMMQQQQQQQQLHAQNQINSEYLKLISRTYPDLLGYYNQNANQNENSNISDESQDTESKKEKPFVPYKKRHFSIGAEQSSNTNEPKKTSSETKPAKPKREVDPNQPKKIKRCPHVWQFCADLLDNDNFNPSIIKWLNKDKGIFKIVKPDKVADLWGAQKNRKSDKKMNYEKMARGMRYSRREGFFKKLDKEKNKPNEYGKQLVFQFSDKVVRDFEWKWSFST